MKKRYAKYVTEHGNTVEIDESIDVVVQLTNEILPAGKVPLEETIVIPGKYIGSEHSVLALREESEYKRAVKRGAA